VIAGGELVSGVVLVMVERNPPKRGKRAIEGDKSKRNLKPKWESVFTVDIVDSPRPFWLSCQLKSVFPHLI